MGEIVPSSLISRFVIIDNETDTSIAFSRPKGPPKTQIASEKNSIQLFISNHTEQYNFLLKITNYKRRSFSPPRQSLPVQLLPVQSLPVQSLPVCAQDSRGSHGKESGPTFPMVLLGNKGDMVHLRQVSSEEGNGRRWSDCF